ncbi:hypothetical protein BHE74_00045606 [Ensete ventricosum]|nr:hypothetical protein BHE74_00045606 [Ensete ventricosum]
MVKRVACGGGEERQARPAMGTTGRLQRRAREAETRHWRQRSSRGVSDEHGSRLEMTATWASEEDANSVVRATKLEQRAMKRRVRLQQGRQWKQRPRRKRLVARQQATSYEEGLRECRGLWHRCGLQKGWQGTAAGIWQQRGSDDRRRAVKALATQLGNGEGWQQWHERRQQRRGGKGQRVGAVVTVRGQRQLLRRWRHGWAAESNGDGGGR